MATLDGRPTLDNPSATSGTKMYWFDPFTSYERDYGKRAVVDIDGQNVRIDPNTGVVYKIQNGNQEIKTGKYAFNEGGTWKLSDTPVQNVYGIKDTGETLPLNANVQAIKVNGANVYVERDTNRVLVKRGDHYIVTDAFASNEGTNAGQFEFKEKEPTKTITDTQKENGNPFSPPGLTGNDPSIDLTNIDPLIQWKFSDIPPQISFDDWWSSTGKDHFATRAEGRVAYDEANKTDGSGFDSSNASGDGSVSGAYPTSAERVSDQQRDAAIDIHKFQTDTARTNYSTNEAAIDAAANELLAGIEGVKTDFEGQSDEYDDYIKFGKNALQALQDEDQDLFRAFTLDDFIKTPAYDLRKREGENYIVNRASAVGVTGDTAIDLLKYNQDYAYDAFGTERDYFTGRQNRRINYLTGASNMGLGALNSQSNIVASIGELDLNASKVNSNRYLDHSTNKVGRNNSILNANTTKSQTLSNIATNYFNAKNESDFNKSIYDINNINQSLNTGLGTAALAYQVSGGPANPASPWIALASGVGGAGVNYFANRRD